MKLLNTNTKLEKSEGLADAWTIAGLTLSPHTLGTGDDVCGAATDGCRDACVMFYSGRQVTTSVRAAMEARKALFFDDRGAFLEKLNREISNAYRTADRKGRRLAVRLNVASDLDWSSVAAAFPYVQFYDYTKVYKRARLAATGDWPANYDLTYSVNERTSDRKLADLLRAGGNAAVVWDTPYVPQHGRLGPMPEWIRVDGSFFQVVDGDRHDLRTRTQDGSGVIVGLRLKGTLASKQHARDTGFARTLDCWAV